MSKRVSRILWITTGIAALLLAAATIHLDQRARLQAPLGETMYIQGAGGSAPIWPQPGKAEGDPDPAQSGAPVTVLDLEQTDDGVWYYIEGALSRGWVREGSLRETPP